MQKFNLHCHTNFCGVFDGNNTAEEMIYSYEQKGFETVGISNHCIYSKFFESTVKQNNFIDTSAMYFYDIDKLIDIHKKSFESIDEAASKHKIKVLKGFEMDFFMSKDWLKAFDKITKELNPDYIIGATHFLRNKDESFLYNLYFFKQMKSEYKKEIKEFVINYWKNVIEAVKSGCFNFIAHPDYCCQFGLAVGDEWDDYKNELIETFYKTKTACEINTKCLRTTGNPSPTWDLVNEMIKKEIPLLISDDAHRIEDVGANFDEVEHRLKELGCNKRFISL